MKRRSNRSALTRTLKWLRIVPRRRFRLIRSSFRRWNGTRGKELREKAQQTSYDIAERTRHELDELKTDSRERYERARPRIEQAAADAREQVESAWKSLKRWLKIAASAVVSTILLAAILAIVFFLVRDGGTPTTDLTCEDCPAFAVTRVIDGDTIDTNVGRIRIFGADTPEIGERCFAEATEEMLHLAGNVVRGERGPRDFDPFGRNLYYVYTESGESIDELLVTNGLARAWRQDGQHRDLLIAAENDARRNNVGCLWK